MLHVIGLLQMTLSGFDHIKEQFIVSNQQAFKSFELFFSKHSSKVDVSYNKLKGLLTFRKKKKRKNILMILDVSFLGKKSHNNRPFCFFSSYLHCSMVDNSCAINTQFPFNLYEVTK